jgi:hypothetical protein
MPSFNQVEKIQGNLEFLRQLFLRKATRQAHFPQPFSKALAKSAHL